jgi:hypothetical protein
MHCVGVTSITLSSFISHFRLVSSYVDTKSSVFPSVGTTQSREPATGLNTHTDGAYVIMK